jgi:hypothetical protein
MERKLDWDGYVTELNYVLNRMHDLLLAGSHCAVGGITGDHPNLTDDLKVPTQIGFSCARTPASWARRSPPRCNRAWIKRRRSRRVRVAPVLSPICGGPGA